MVSPYSLSVVAFNSILVRPLSCSSGNLREAQGLKRILGSPENGVSDAVSRDADKASGGISAKQLFADEGVFQ
jgi:hypothetical protein